MIEAEGRFDEGKSNNVDQFIGFRIARTGRMLKRQAIRIISDNSDLALVEWQVLGTIGSSSRTSVADLITKAAIDKAQFSRGLASLCDRGLVEKLQHATDGRKTTVRMTSAGRAAYQELLPRMKARDESLRASLTQNEQRKLTRILEKIETAIG